MRSGVITTLILLSLAFGYVFVTNWKVYEVSLLNKDGDARKSEEQCQCGDQSTNGKPSRPGTETKKILLGNNLVSAVVAPLSSKPSSVTIHVEAPQDSNMIHHRDYDNMTE